jgi:error-prone DNA polymerase
VHGRRVCIGGVITHRQRPMTARGVIFLNLEDETGLLNVIVLPGVWQANREVARRSIGVVVDGVLEHRDGVTNLVARRFGAWSDEITGLGSRDWARGRG